MENEKLYILNTNKNFLLISTMANEEEDEIVMEFRPLDYRKIEKLISKWNRERKIECIKEMFKYKV